MRLLKYSLWEINKSYTTQTYSCCWPRQNSRADLRIREWTCKYAVTIDRYINAAINNQHIGNNMFRVGLNRIPGEKVSTLAELVFESY